jgi:hypothetical protein
MEISSILKLFMTLASANFPVGLYGVRLAYQTSALRISKASLTRKHFLETALSVSSVTTPPIHYLSTAYRSFFWLEQETRTAKICGTFNSPQPFQPLNPTNSSSAVLTSPYLKQPPTIFFATSLKK